MDNPVLRFRDDTKPFMRKVNSLAFCLIGIAFMYGSSTFAEEPVTSADTPISVRQTVIHSEIGGNVTENQDGVVSAGVRSSGRRTTEEAGIITSVGIGASLDSHTKTANGNAGQIENSGSITLERNWGDAPGKPSEPIRTQTLRLSYTRDATVGETGAFLIGYGLQVARGSREAPVGSVGPLLIQPGMSSRVAFLAEVGLGRMDGIEPSVQGRGHAKFEETIQYCKMLDSAEKNAICMSLLANQTLGYQLGAGGGAEIKYAHAISDGAKKDYFYVGPNAGAAVLSRSSDTIKSNGGAQAGVVAGIAW